MNNLVSFVNGAPVVSSSIIASHTQNQHKNVIELIKRYESDFAEFGRVAFETEPFRTAGGVQELKICRLNEDQAALLMTYLRNSEVVRNFKKSLIRAFKEAKQTPNLPDFSDPVAAARAWADAKESEQKALANLEAAKPAIQFTETVTKSEHTYSYSEAGKKIQQRPRKFCDWLKLQGYVMANGLPYQRYIDQGVLVMHTGINHLEHEFSQGRVTTKGLQYFSDKLAEVKL